MVYQTEKILSETGDKIDAADRADVEAELNKLKETLKGSDFDAIKNATESLTQTFYKVSEKLYQNAAPQGDPTQGAYQGGDYNRDGFNQTPPSGNNVYDADYEIIDDDKK